MGLLSLQVRSPADPLSGTQVDSNGKKANETSLAPGQIQKRRMRLDLKPFVAIQSVRRPPGKGQASRPEASFAGVVATSLLKRKQQVPKPRN